MNVHELLEQQFGVSSVYEINPEVDEISHLAVTKFLSYNPRRLSFVLVNLGATEIVVAPDNSVLLDKGIHLVAAGGTLSMVWTEDFEMPTFEWYGIAKTAACKIYVLEVLTQ